MEIKKQLYRCRCGINNCTRDAEYRITGEGVMANREISICKKCAAELIQKLGAKLDENCGKAVGNGKRNNQNILRR